MTIKLGLKVAAITVLTVFALALWGGGKTSCSDPAVVKTLHDLMFQQIAVTSDLHIGTLSTDLSIDVADVRTIDAAFPPNGATCMATILVVRKPAGEPASRASSINLEIPYTYQSNDNGNGFVVTIGR